MGAESMWLQPLISSTFTERWAGGGWKGRPGQGSSQVEWGGAGLALGRRVSSLSRRQSEYCSINLNGGETKALEEVVTCLH